VLTFARLACAVATLLHPRGRRQIRVEPVRRHQRNGKEFLIRAEFPAVPKEDVTVTLNQSSLPIEEEVFYLNETFHGTFMHRFLLPEDANADALRCESKDGILTMHVPKVQKRSSKAKQIPVD
jgi:HSP20 family protein